MPTATGASPVEGAYILEVLEVTNSILQRHYDHELAEKTFALQTYLEMNRTGGEPDYDEKLLNALADLTATVSSDLNRELEAAVALFVKLP
jgi:hypothetical protein